MLSCISDSKHFLEFVQQNDQLLKHEVVKEVFLKKWRAEAALKYYFDLFWFIVYVAFFTVYIECKGNTNVEPKLLLSAKYISLILALVNLILEVFQCMMHIVNFKFLQYIQRWVTWGFEFKTFYRRIATNMFGTYL